MIGGLLPGTLPPRSHPAWPMVLTIGFVGATVTGWLGGSALVSGTCLLLALLFGALSVRAIRRASPPER